MEQQTGLAYRTALPAFRTRYRAGRFLDAWLRAGYLGACRGLVGVVALCAAAVGKDTLIDARVAYSSGVVAIGYLDTVSFTTGIRLWSIAVCGGMCSEQSANVVGYLGVPYGSAGMRWMPGTVSDHFCFLTAVIYAPPPDTTWAGAWPFPDSLVALDTLGSLYFAWRPDYRWPDLVAKVWSCSSHVFAPPRGFLAPDWNYITYASCPDGSRMSFQFALDTLIGGASGEVVRWAVDSAGNGLFRVGPTPVRETRLPAREAPGLSSRLRQYDIRGRVLPPPATRPGWNAPQRPRALVAAGGRLVWRE